MLKVGDILWIFHENDYFIGEVSKISVVDINLDEKECCFISTNGIIGGNQMIYVPITVDFNTLVKQRFYSEVIYYTTNEQVAVNYIKTHFNETDNQRNLQQDAPK